ncbi:pilus assembly protein PilX [Comamonas flocculans]|uniref:Pilus assembly protein PilX n=1 Tax=Comamonas flocculans TaxID=2597701 RepID=A0A5B8RXA4_9BURK|nr:pilus assembly protein PilX [Comamonas flocculans]
MSSLICSPPPRPIVSRALRPLKRRASQHGIALFVVIVFVMLSMLLALWASRTSMFNELVVGNDADYQRAFEAAQALLQDAELDIRGQTADGKPCAAPCRQWNFTQLQFPTEAKEINGLVATLNAAEGKCKDGLCARRTGHQDFWNYENDVTPVSPPDAGEVTLDKLTKSGVGARYGEYTGAQLGDKDNPANPILARRGGPKEGGWYWIEVMPYSDAAKTANLIVSSEASNQLSLNLDVYVIYRITALAYGLKDSTKVVLQQTYARQRMKD